VQAQELLANITLLEVAVLKLEEQSSILQSEVGQARTEREIAELRHSSSESAHLGSEGSTLHSVSSDSNRSLEDDHTTRSPGTAPESQNQHLTVFNTPKSTETTVLESSEPLGNAAPGRASDSQKLQKSWKVCFNKPLEFTYQVSNLEINIFTVMVVLCNWFHILVLFTYCSYFG
jgi:hypothetical protein